jgi:hypothetical protein
MQIVPTADGSNISKCINTARILRGFVSLLGVRIFSSNNHLPELIRSFNGQTFEVELFMYSENYEEKLNTIIRTHSDVNIGKVFFYTNNPETVEQSITNIRIFGINPGILIDDRNYNKPSVVNKFEYGIINVKRYPNYMDLYKHIKANEYKGSLLLDFEEQKVSEDIIKNEIIDGIYVDVTNNPSIKDTISVYRRAANSIY